MNSQEIIESLPSVRAWGTDLCLYQGFWWFPAHCKGLILSQNNFQALESDLLLATTVKSGTTWLKALVFAITKRSQHPTRDPNHPLLSKNPHELIPFVGDQSDTNSNKFQIIPPPRLLSTHSSFSTLPESVKTTKCRIIYLSRDPKDVFISMWHFVNATMRVSDGSANAAPLEEAFELFCKGISPTGPVWDHALDYWNASLKEPEKVLFLKYEDLKSDIVSQVKKMAEFAGYPFSAEEESNGVIEEIVNLCSFNNLSKLNVSKGKGEREHPSVLSEIMTIKNEDFFRKGEVGDWKNHLTPSMRQQLDQVIEQKLSGSGLKFD